MLMLEVIHTLMKYAQHWDVFVNNFVDVVNLFYFKSLHLYINPISTFDDLVFDEFLKLLSHSHDVFLLS
jgi:hypothetical protein